MHIADGILSTPVLASGGILTAVGLGVGLKHLSHEKIPQTAILSAVFFVASLIHVPLGPSSVHLLLNGLTGIILGWTAFPALFVALFLQAILFQFGGLTTLGVNTFNMAFPAIVVYFICRPLLKTKKVWTLTLSGILAALIGIGLGGLLIALELCLIGKGFITIAKLILMAHLPVIIIEAVITITVLHFLVKVKPETLGLTALILFFFLLKPALAHKISTFAYVENGVVYTETYFSDGKGAKNAQVQVYDKNKQKLLLEGKTDQNGCFSFKPPVITDLKIVVNAGVGHQAVAFIESTELGVEENIKEEKQKETLLIQETKIREVDIRQIIKEELNKQLKPVMKKLLKIERELSKPSFTTILGGIGYIFGLFGIWAYLKRK